MDVNGSPEYALIWKAWDMPSGVPICALRASPRRTGAKGCSGWVSPTAMDGNRGSLPPRPHDTGIPLSQQVAMAGWPTPATPSGGRSMSPDKMDATGRTIDGKKHTASLEHAVKFAGWPTPMAGNPGTEEYNPAGNTDSSRKTVALVAGWATPAERDYRHPNAKPFSSRGGGKKGEQLPNQAAHLAGWPTPNALALTRGGFQTDPEKALERRKQGHALNLDDAVCMIGATPGSPAPTEKRGALNPAFSLWLQGFPVAWACCAAPVTRSSRKSRRNSSVPASISSEA